MYAKVIINLNIPKLDYSFTYKIPKKLNNIIKLGTCVLIPFGNNNNIIEGFVIEIIELNNFNKKTKSIIDINKNKIFPDKNMLILANKIKKFYFITYSNSLRLMYLSLNNNCKKNYDNYIFCITKEGIRASSTMRKSKKKIFLKTLIEKDIKISDIKNITITKNIIFELLKNKYITYKTLNLFDKNIYLKNLNKEQINIFNIIKKYLNKNENKNFLLFGVTGSGKTEIYFHAINEILNAGKQVLILFPEINLTEQMINRFELVFPNNVARWHSKISKKEKKQIIIDLKNKNKNILIGSRSAIFVPLNNLGLIIIDEEHDMNYSQDTMPVYNAKKVALMRAKIEKISVILGSATPSIESYFEAKKNNYKLLVLKNKYFNKESPKIKIINMGKELKKGNLTIFSDILKNYIKNTLSEKKQVILFLNRRGFYNFLLCRDCGFVLKCDSCNIPLTYHKEKNIMICHYCGKEKEYYKICPKCKSKRFRGIGIGTEQVVMTTKKIFNNKKIARFDGDLKINIKEKQLILENFKKSKIDILVGTQMISKGIDFPNIELIGILLADLSFNIPDYRANEWMFQLIVQLIGRACRRNKKGTVILQTYRPSNMIFNKIIKQDYNEFYKKEILFRKNFNYPPFVEIFRLQIKGKIEKNVIKKTWELFKKLKKNLLKEEFFLPKSSYLKKINNKYNWFILFKIKKNTKRLKKIEEYFQKFLENEYKNLSNDLNIYIERDPKGFL